MMSMGMGAGRLHSIDHGMLCASQCYKRGVTDEY
jgi:hypothetical protein